MATVGLSESQKMVCSIIPPLSMSSHKGQSGRIGIIGGSKEYTGAPYFAAISALKVGADLSYVFSQEAAAQIIKCYSPELIVHPILDKESAVSDFENHLNRLHAVVIGPGLGREPKIMDTVEGIVKKVKEVGLPLIIDADGLFFLNSHIDIIKGYKKAILTPNVAEFKTLHWTVMGEGATTDPQEMVKQLAQSLGNVTVVRKGPEDIISNGEETITCRELGSPRRCGGQGDVLSGSLGTFSFWASLKGISPIAAALGSCMLTRRCNRLAFQKYSRTMTTTDMISEIKNAFQALFPID